MDEPITSLLQREVTILSKNFGQLRQTCWEISRLLLRLREEYAKDDSQQGDVGGGILSANPQADPLPADLFLGMDVS